MEKLLKEILRTLKLIDGRLRRIEKQLRENDENEESEDNEQ